MGICCPGTGAVRRLPVNAVDPVDPVLGIAVRMRMADHMAGPR